MISPVSPKAPPSLSTAFLSEDSEWHHVIVAFLERHPNSSLLAVVQHLWPDFLNYPTDRRARLWFRVKAQLLAMEKVGVLECQQCESDVSVWALRSR